jgi:hypothetical protein
MGIVWRLKEGGGGSVEWAEGAAPSSTSTDTARVPPEGRGVVLSNAVPPHPHGKELLYVHYYSILKSGAVTRSALALSVAVLVCVRVGALVVAVAAHERKVTCSARQFSLAQLSDNEYEEALLDASHPAHPNVCTYVYTYILLSRQAVRVKSRPLPTGDQGPKRPLASVLLSSARSSLPLLLLLDGRGRTASNSSHFNSSPHP